MGKGSRSAKNRVRGRSDNNRGMIYSVKGKDQKITRFTRRTMAEVLEHKDALKKFLQGLDVLHAYTDGNTVSPFPSKRRSEKKKVVGFDLSVSPVSGSLHVVVAVLEGGVRAICTAEMLDMAKAWTMATRTRIV